LIGFTDLLRTNRNYRFMWLGQVVSEIGDHFNNIAVFSLALEHTKSGLVVSGVMLARAIPAVLAGPIAGVLLDRVDRRRIMIISDLFRFIIALGFILSVHAKGNWTLYVFSALLMFASPFFTSGRSAILPRIANKEELHAANSLTQTTQWTTLTIGTFLAGISVMKFGYTGAFIFNALSFLISALCIWQLRVPEGFQPRRRELNETEVVRPWHEYAEGLKYMKSSPLILAIGLVGVGWASGGGASQILFSVFGELVFHRGPDGISIIWGCAGVGLLIGAAFAHVVARKFNFDQYKKSVVFCYIIHGGAYVFFSQMPTIQWACVFIALSRAAVGVSSIANFSQLLRHVPDEFRGRVFSTMESMTWSTMMLSMLAAGVASQYYDPRAIAACAGIVSSTTAIFWGWANWTGRLPEPAIQESEEELELHGDPTV
jgi:MFS family permease